MRKIPSVDLNDFLSEDEALKQKFVSEIGDAYESIGFVALKGHFLKDALVTALYSEIKTFFDLPVFFNSIMFALTKSSACLLLFERPLRYVISTAHGWV